MMKVNILGAEYTVIVKTYDENEAFKRYGVNGYCSYPDHSIVLCDMMTYPAWENETKEACADQMKITLRHEVVHAFLGESGLSANSIETDSWAINEEMIDWIALQGPKIYTVWQVIGAL